MEKNDVLPIQSTDFAGSTPTDSYRVGHGRPPKHTQFKPGQSGNPTDTAIALTIIPLVISMFKGSDEDDGELTGQQQALIENFEARQEISKSPTQSGAEQSSNDQLDGDATLAIRALKPFPRAHSQTTIRGGTREAATPLSNSRARPCQPSRDCELQHRCRYGKRLSASCCGSDRQFVAPECSRKHSVLGVQDSDKSTLLDRLSFIRRRSSLQ